PIFCVALCVGAVFSFLKTDNGLTASADATADEFTLKRTAQRFWYASKQSPASISYAEMWGVADAGHLATDIDSSAHALGWGGNTANAYGEAIYLEVTENITVPARQEYTVVYDLEYYSLRTAYVKSSIILEVFNFGYSNDAQTAPTGQSLGLIFGYSGTGSKYSIDFLADNTFSANTGCSGDSQVEVTYRNESYDKSETFSQRFGFWTGLGYGGATLYGECVFKPSVTEVKDLALELPSSVSTDYTGTEYTTADLGTIDGIINASWYDPAKMNLSLREDAACNAGTYNIDVTLIDTDATTGYPWKLADGSFSFEPQSTTLIINKVTPTVVPVFPSTRPVVSNGFPQPTSYTATAGGKSITGTFDWVNQTQLIEVDKPKEYEWTFKPDNNNYLTVKGKLTLNFQERKIVSKTYAWKSEITKIYTKTSVGELMDMLTLQVTYNDSSTPVYETNFAIESVNLVAGYGNSYLMVSFGGAPEKFIIPNTVEVIEAAV
ncbi:MAG: hypothetical protein K2G26_05520, partial [Clostridia bacterium]|nr:hypothetical protein [Clostridia bacterium]